MVPRRATHDPLSPPRQRGRGGTHNPARSPARSRRREEVEAGAGGGAGQGEAEEGVGEGDGDTRHDADLDAGLAGPDEAAELLGTLPHRGAGALPTGGDERGEVVGGDDAG